VDKDRQRAKQLFSTMSKGEKLKYIGRYYWLHIIGAVLAVVVLVSAGVSIYSNHVSSKWLHVGSTAPYTQRLRQPLEALGQANGEPLNYLELLSVEGEYGADAMVQLSCYLTADQLDILVCDAPTREYLLLQDGEENLTVYPLEETTLAALFADIEQPELYLIVRHGLSRSDRAEDFAQLLVTDATP